MSPEVIQARNEWLRKALARTGNKPKILCCHIPLVNFRDEAVLSQSFGRITGTYNPFNYVGASRSDASARTMQMALRFSF